jgi:anti-anti-sigma factor
VQTDQPFRAEILRPQERVLVFAVEGALDIGSAAGFRQIFLTTVGQGAQRVIVDLTKMTSLDSTGLGLLVAGAKRAAKGSLCLVCPDEAVTAIFAMVGLDRIAAVFGSMQAALASTAGATV